VIGDRSLSHRLDMVEQGLTTLVADDVAQNAAEQSDLVTQGVVGGGTHHLKYPGTAWGWRGEVGIWKGEVARVNARSVTAAPRNHRVDHGEPPVRVS